jgi:hypothetical protein
MFNSTMDEKKSALKENWNRVEQKFQIIYYRRASLLQPLPAKEIRKMEQR